MPVPIEAGEHLKEVQAVVQRPKRAAALSLDNTLGRLLEEAWGKPYNHNTFVFACLLACRMFSPDASPRSMMLDFSRTFETLVEHSKAYTQHEWTKLLNGIMRDEARAARNVQDISNSARHVANPKKTAHFTFDTKRWFPRIKGARQRVRARTLAMKAALACRISPSLYLWENGLVEFNVLRG